MQSPVTQKIDAVISRYGGVIYAAILLGVAWLSSFGILSNDCFPLRWQAEHLSFYRPATFYNGFFPIGYPLLLRLGSLTGNSILALMLFQIALSGFFVHWAYKLFRNFLDPEIAPIALLGLLFSPQILRAILSVTPDFLATFAALLAAWAYVKNRFALVGTLLGVGYLLRQHFVVLLIAFFISFLLAEKSGRLKRMGIIALSFLPFFLFQGLIQIWSGRGFFENAQAFNVWKTMYGMDWNNPPDLQGKGALDIVKRDPILLFTCVGIGIVDSVASLIPLILACIHAGYHRKIKLIVLASAFFLYIVLNTPGGSPRSLTLAMPIVVLSYGHIAEIIRKKFTDRGSVLLAAAFFAGTVAAIVVVVFSTLRIRERMNDYDAVQAVLNIRTIDDAKRIYTDDFDLTFPKLKYATPHTSGGWWKSGLPEYYAPTIRDSTSQIEHSDLVKANIKWAVYRIPPYDEKGYNHVKSDTALFRLVSKTVAHAIYEVQ